MGICLSEHPKSVVLTRAAMEPIFGSDLDPDPCMWDHEHSV